MDHSFPTGFEELERFLPYWDVPTSQDRIDRRSRASWAENREFYDAMLARGADILAHVEQFPLDAIPEDSARLFRLLLALAHVSMSIELHGQVIAPNAPFPNSIMIVEGASPFG